MCGIVAVVRKPVRRPIPDQRRVLGLITPLPEVLTGIGTGNGQLLLQDGSDLPEALSQAAESLEDANGMLRGVAGLRLLLDSPRVVDSLREAVAGWNQSLRTLETAVDRAADAGGTSGLARRGEPRFDPCA